MNFGKVVIWGMAEQMFAWLLRCTTKTRSWVKILGQLVGLLLLLSIILVVNQLRPELG